jgi:hypothetical protein
MNKGYGADMGKKIIIFNIGNYAKDYTAAARFCDSFKNTAYRRNICGELEGRVFLYEPEENEKPDKIFSQTSKGLIEGTLSPFDERAVAEGEEVGFFLHVKHEADDATIEYIYLEALFHKFPNMYAFLYASNPEKNVRYAIWAKAVDFFCGFCPETDYKKQRIYGEYLRARDQIWEIVQLEPRMGERAFSHAKVSPVIRLDRQEDELRFWRERVKEPSRTRDENDRFRRIMQRCRSNFIGEYKRNSQNRKKYYERVYDDREFQKEISEMPMLAFYLFCLQMYYCKQSQVRKMEYIKKVQMNAWDIADGVLQLMENVRYSTRGQGFVEIRIHQNQQEKRYLRENYGIEDNEHEFYYEIRLLDLSQENMVDNFRKKVLNGGNLHEMCVSHFFEHKTNCHVSDFWEDYNRTVENLVHHYGLQIFSTVVSANKGYFKVVSSGGYEYNADTDVYINKDTWKSEDAGRYHLPGTEYFILLPLLDQRQQVVTSVESDVNYQYDMEVEYKVEACVWNRIKFSEYKDVSDAQKRKERQINDIAQQIYCWIEEAADDAGNEFVIQISLQQDIKVSSEMFCKSLLLSGMYWIDRKDRDFYCILSECAENQMLEIVRLFGIFYSKSCLPEYIAKMQIYLAGDCGELLITGSDLRSLYTITSKVMLVKGINRETDWILRYLLEQYGGRNKGLEEKGMIKLVPFDTLELPERDRTLFEENVRKTLNADIQKHSLGCKISPTHMRAGSKIHIGTFYEAEIIFHNNYYVSRFANLILKRLNFDPEKRLMLVGYENYSELLLYEIVINIREKIKGVQAEYMIYEQRTGGKFRYMGAEPSEMHVEEWQFAIIIPINSTLTTHNKVRESLEEEISAGYCGDNKQINIIANYALILIRSGDGPERVGMEKRFWREISGQTIKTDLIPENEPDVEFFVSVNTLWYSPLTCPLCFPQDYRQETPLIETNRTSVVPVQMIGLCEPDLLEQMKREQDPENLCRVQKLKNVLVYNHVVRNGNHYMYYFCMEKYFVQERGRIIEWLKEERKKRTEVKGRVVYDIIVSPLHYSNAGFLAEVNHYLFDNAALVLNFEIEKEFRENVKTKYSNIIGLYNDLQYMEQQALIRFHFVDDTIVSGRTYQRAKNLFQSLIHTKDDKIEIEVFSDVVVLLNRLSPSSIQHIINNSGRGNVDQQRMQRFHAYVNLNISSMRNHEDACTECKLVQNFTNLREQSSTNQQYRFWHDKIIRLSPEEIQDKREEELLLAAGREEKERAYRRMICTHLANEKIGALGHKKNIAEDVSKVMIALMEEEREEQIEWLISYIKVFSRPFISFLKSSREAIFQIMLDMIEYMTTGLINGKKARGFPQIKKLCLFLLEERNHGDEKVYCVLLTLMKRLSDLGSNYIIRKDNIVRLLNTVDAFKISDKEKQKFRAYYVSIIKRMCCQSSDESKSVFLEYLCLFGKEYGADNVKIEDFRKYDKGLLFLHDNADADFIQRVYFENVRALNDGIRELAKDYEKEKNVDKIVRAYYYGYFKETLYFYGVFDFQRECFTEEGRVLAESLIELYQFLGDVTEKDPEEYYKKLLKSIGKVTGAERTYLLYGALEEKGDERQYYRIQASGKMENLRGTQQMGLDKLIADTYVLPFEVEDDSMKLKRTMVKYQIAGGDTGNGNRQAENTIFLQMDFPADMQQAVILFALKIVMAFHAMIVRHLKHDFSNNMIQKWSAKEYFNKQVMLQRATDHTDRDNLQKYYKYILELHGSGNNLQKEEKERYRALFHMVVNSYIARMNVQILADSNPEREPSRASFEAVYRKQLKRLLDSLHMVEEFKILDENGRACFSQSLLEDRVRIRKTEAGESLSYRRICVMIAELILSAISHSGRKETADVYIYREEGYLVVKNRFRSAKNKAEIDKDIKDSIERKKDGISLAAIKGTVNACYGLTEEDGVQIFATVEDRKKFFYVKLPILTVWEE